MLRMVRIEQNGENDCFFLSEVCTVELYTVQKSTGIPLVCAEFESELASKGVPRHGQRGERRGACSWCDCRSRVPAFSLHRIDHLCEQAVAKMCAQKNVRTVWQDPHLARRALHPEGRADRRQEVCVHFRTTHVGVRANRAAAASEGGSREGKEGG